MIEGKSNPEIIQQQLAGYEAQDHPESEYSFLDYSALVIVPLIIGLFTAWLNRRRKKDED